jgi:hypothetical protein
MAPMVGIQSIIKFVQISHAMTKLWRKVITRVLQKHQ